MDNFRRYLTREELPDTVQEFDLQNLQYPMTVKAVYVPYIKTRTKYFSWDIVARAVYNTRGNYLNSISYTWLGGTGSSVSLSFGNIELSLGQSLINDPWKEYQIQPYIRLRNSSTSSQYSNSYNVTNSKTAAGIFYNPYSDYESWYIKLSLENFTCSPQTPDHFPYMYLISGTPSFSGGMTYDDLPPFYYEPVTE